MRFSTVRWLACCALVPCLFAHPVSAQSVELDFSSLGSAMISFDGATSELDFIPDSSSGYAFKIASSTVPSLVGYYGNIIGDFSIGHVTQISSSPFLVEDGNVSGSGILTISDGSPSVLTADVTWNNVATLGTGGVLDAIGEPNLSKFAYSGTNPVLQQLAGSTYGLVSASFQFLPAETLADLATGGGVNATTFSGSLIAIPEPKYSAAILGGTLFLVAGALRGAGKRIRWITAHGA